MPLLFIGEENLRLPSHYDCELPLNLRVIQNSFEVCLHHDTVCLKSWPKSLLGSINVLELRERLKRIPISKRSGVDEAEYRTGDFDVSTKCSPPFGFSVTAMLIVREMHEVTNISFYLEEVIFRLRKSTFSLPFELSHHLINYC